MSQGIEKIVGVPGANVKKAAWIETLDKLGDGLKKYILYDNDKAGKKAAQDIASRIGYDKCLKLTLPYFEVEVPLDECKLCDENGYSIKEGTDKKIQCLHKRPGKDINEWFTKGGGTVEAFENLKRNAALFDVTGVVSSASVLDEIEEELNGKTDLAPKYSTRWEDFNNLVGFEDGDVIDIVAPGKIGKTTWGMNLIDDMVERYGEDGLIVCLEMTQKRMARKWVSKVTGFEEVLTKPESPEAVAKLEEFKASVAKAKEIQRMRTADLYFAYPQLVKEPEDVYKLMRDCIRRYGVKWIMFDNLQLLCDTVIGGRQGQRTVILSQISKALAKIAKDYGIKMIRIVQPKQIDKDETITSRDVDGSSQIEKDCDAQILLWRRCLSVRKQSAYAEEAEEAEDSNEVFDSLMRVIVSLSRYSSGGKCWMVFDGARSQVKSKTRDTVKAAPQQNFNGLIPMEGSTMVTLPQEKPQTTSLPTEADI